MLYSDTTGSNNEYDNGTSIVGDPNSDSLVNQENDFTYDSNPDLNPTSSENVTANMSEADKQAIAKIMQQGSNANTATSGGPGKTTDYFSSLMAGLKAKTLDLGSLSPALQRAVTGTTPAAPSFLDKVGNFLGTTTARRLGLAGWRRFSKLWGTRVRARFTRVIKAVFPTYPLPGL